MKHIKNYQSFNEGFKELLVATAMSLGLITNSTGQIKIHPKGELVSKSDSSKMSSNDYIKYMDSYLNSQFNDSNLEKAKDYWKKWLNTTETIKKLAKFHKTNEEDIKNNYVPKWIKTIEPIKIKFVDLGDNSIASVSPDLKDHNLYVNKIMFANLGEKYKISVKPIEIMVHELQHKMYSLIPINPKVAVDSILDLKKSHSIKIDSSNIERTSKDFNIDSLEIVKKRMISFFNQYNNEIRYTNDFNEITSRIAAIRYRSGVNKLSIDLFKETFLGKNSDPNISWLISVWAGKDFPPFEQFINELDSLA